MKMFDPEQLDAAPGAVVLNASACFPDLEQLRAHFDVVVFLDFCVGIEAAVLHREIHGLGTSVIEQPVLEALVDAGVVEHYSGFVGSHEATARAGELLQNHPRILEMQEQGVTFGLDVDAIRAIAERPQPTLEPGGDMHAFGIAIQEHLTETLRLVGEVQRNAGPHLVRTPERWEVMAIASDAVNMMALERATTIPIAHPAHALPGILSTTSIDEESRVKGLIDDAVAGQLLDRKYEELKEHLVERQVASGARARHETLRIPPIAFDVLGRVRDLESVPYSLLEVRDAYSGVRDRFAEWDALLRSDLPPTEISKREIRLRKDWDALVGTSTTGWADVCTAVGGLLAIAGTLQKPVAEFSHLDWVGVAAALLGTAPFIAHAGTRARSRFYLRPLYATRDVFDGATRAQLHELVSRHFGHELSDEELRTARAYLSRWSSGKSGKQVVNDQPDRTPQ